MSNGEQTRTRIAPRRSESQDGRSRQWSSYARVWIIAGVAIIAGIIVWQAVNVFLLIFAAILLGLFLRGVSDFLSRWARVPPKWSLTITVIVLLLLVTGVFWLIGPELSKQATRLTQELPRSVTQVLEQLQRYESGRQLLDLMQRAGDRLQQSSLMPKVTGFVSSFFNVVVSVVVLAFIGLYLAANPGQYVRGAVRLFPQPKRRRAREVLSCLGTTLQRWIVGRLFLMTTNGIVTTIALTLMGVPLALSLGILSGLLNFIPNFGPIIAAIPAILIALLEGGSKALYVLILFVVYQNIDGYILTPMVEKYTVASPPALTIAAQVLAGVLLGTLGVLLAVPIAAAALVIVKMVYVEDTLGDRPG